MAEVSFTTWCVKFCIFGPSFILQSIGFFAPNWVKTETCDAIGLFYRCCGGNDTGCVVNGADTYLNKNVLELQATSFSILAVAFISVCYLVNCTKKDPSQDYAACNLFLATISGLLYPISGLLSVIGCIKLAKEYSTSELSWGFYLSFVAGCYILLLLLLLITLCCCVIIGAAVSDDNIVDNRNSSETTVAMTQSSGQITQGHRRSLTDAELHERHEINEDDGMAFHLKKNVFQILHNFGLD